VRDFRVQFGRELGLETIVDGALGLQPGLLQGTTLINLDRETEGTFLISSAGGTAANAIP
jgi:hypothetical protein